MEKAESNLQLAQWQQEWDELHRRILELETTKDVMEWRNLRHKMLDMAMTKPTIASMRHVS